MVFAFSTNVTSFLCVLLLLTLEHIESVVLDWNQIGSDIDSEAAVDFFGSSVAMSADGKTIAVGAGFNDGGGIDSGHVRVYKLNVAPDQFTQFGPDIDGSTAGDVFGNSLAMSADGNTIVVGAPGNSDVAFRNGKVQLFRVDTTQSSVVQYQQIGSDILGDAAEAEYFGASVAMSADGNTFVVSTVYNDRNGNVAGLARVFKFNLLQITKIGPDLVGKGSGDLFGSSLAMSADGKTIAIGGGVGAGYFRIYQLNINQYIQFGSDILGEAPGDVSGSSLAMSADGRTIAVGARFNDGSGIDAGHVRVYKTNSPGQQYAQIGFDIDGEAAGDLSGTSVAMSSDGTTIAIGTTNANHIRVFKLNAGQYIQIGNDINGESAGDEFSTIDMSSDGTMLVVGARYNSGITGLYSGSVRVFRYSPVPTKTPTKSPTKKPTKSPTRFPTKKPTRSPTKTPTTKSPTKTPTRLPTKSPTNAPTKNPTRLPTTTPTKTPMRLPTKKPTKSPTKTPTRVPIKTPTKSPTTTPAMKLPTTMPTKVPVLLVPTKDPVVTCGWFCRLCQFKCRVFGWC